MDAIITSTTTIMSTIHSVITGTGSYIPTQVIKNEHFLQHEFYERNGDEITLDNATILQKFHKITGIKERRYATDKQMASDLGYLAAVEAIRNAGIDKEELGGIILGHNFGDVEKSRGVVDTMPSLAARVKQKLEIKNPYCTAYDVIFGCPGWVEGMIQADRLIKLGEAKHVLVIGTETLSRVVDPHDRDSMIYADGAGATILSATTESAGITAHLTRSDTLEHAKLLWMGESYKENGEDDLYIKMEGRKLYEYALTHVPPLVKECLEKANIDLTDVKKVLIHQANEKMDEAMLYRLFKSYGIREIPEHVMPMIIENMGNNSVATIPILLDRVMRGELENHELTSGDYIVFASVGAGMNCNAIVYQVPSV